MICVLKGESEVEKKKISPWPAAIVAFFSVIFIVNFTFLYFAVKSDDGLTDADYYRKGLLYNNKITEERMLGWNIELSFDGIPKPQGNTVKVDIKDSENRWVKDAEVMLFLKRPATNKFDSSVTLYLKDGSYSGIISIPLEGYWYMDVKAARSGKSIEKSFKVKV